MKTKGTAKAVKVRKMKTFYSVELAATMYNDDTFISENLEDCRRYCTENGYTDEDARIAEYLDDGDPLVTAFHTIEE